MSEAPEETSKSVEKENVEQDEVPTRWEDAKEEGSRGTDNKSLLEVELFIKGDGFEEDSEDTVEEEMMKQVEFPKNWEAIKKELTSGADISWNNDRRGVKNKA
jgi:hypothetical protein